MKVLVVGGGISDEREVSLRSAAAVHEAAKKAGHEATLYDWQGGWQWLEEKVGNFDVALPILHGKGGEDGMIQTFLEGAKAKFLGSGVEASEVCFYKERANKLFQKNDILIPRGDTVDYQTYLKSDIRESAHVLKPLDGGSSIDTFINIQKDQISQNILKKVFDKHGVMLLEEFVSGPELTVPILEGHDLPTIEIIPPKDGVFDYENKYNGATTELCPPQNISKDIQAQAKILAKQAHDAAGCRHISRVDMIFHQNKLYVLEINTMPGMTDASLFPKATQHAGLDMPTLVDYLIRISL